MEPQLKVKLSAFMRVGAVGRAQAFGDFMTDTGAVCALGAAMVGKYGPSIDPDIIFVDDFLVEVNTPPQVQGLWCPVRSCTDEYYRHTEEGRAICLADLVTHLNDEHRWGIKRIADWLESKGY